eukprot:scaffold611628_cov14-Prasinocladus_malaysianus.AAC.1
MRTKRPNPVLEYIKAQAGFLDIGHSNCKYFHGFMKFPTLSDTSLRVAMARREIFVYERQ